MANVKFNRGKTRANAITAAKTSAGYSTVYFPTDSATIILGVGSTTSNREYGQAVQDSAGTTKAFLLGHAAQGTTAITISNANVYMQTNKLYSNNSEVVNVADAQSISGTKTFTVKPVINLSTTSNTTALDIITGDTDKFIRFGYNATDSAGASWRVGMVGSGSSDTNYFSIQTGTSTTSATAWAPAVQFGQNTKDATFFGKIIKSGGTGSQFLMGDGSVKTLSTTPTSGSTDPISSGAMYTALAGVVHLANTETITGVKTFSQGLAVTGTSGATTPGVKLVYNTTTDSLDFTFI